MQFIIHIEMLWLLVILGIGSLVAYNQFNEARRRKSRLNVPISKPQPKPRLNTKPLDLESIRLTPEQQALFENLEQTGGHVFVTGKAGTGKSVLLQYFTYHSSKRLVVVAPTGVAALNIGGQTINSLFRIPPAFIPQRSLTVHPQTELILRHIDAVVIDEISMVRADLMDAMDYLLRQARGNDKPFGGVQMLMFGDLYQLQPVVEDNELHKYFADNHGSFYFFNAHVWREASLKIYELSTILRQKDDVFQKLLNAIRTGKVSHSTLSTLNKRTEETPPPEGVITLASTNAAVTALNHKKLAALSGAVRQYIAIVVGNLERSAFPTEEILTLKKGAQVMMLRNDPGKRWVNGTLGSIESLAPEAIKVNIDGYIYSIAPHTWNKIRYHYDRETKRVEEEITSSFTQYPLRLAWAITIHKSQGQTYEAVDIDMSSRAFAHGQTYVALSRCRSLEHLYLKHPVAMEDIIVDPVVTEFMAKATVLSSASSLSASKMESRS